MWCLGGKEGGEGNTVCIIFKNVTEMAFLAQQSGSLDFIMRVAATQTLQVFTGWKIASVGSVYIMCQSLVRLGMKVVRNYDVLSGLI